MKITRLVLLTALLTTSAMSSTTEQTLKLGDNAALRYWSAFSQMQDTAVSDEEAKELNSILEGTAPYSDARYKDIVEKNRSALETVARGTAMPNCDWGIESQLGSDTPVEYVRKALTLGRLNVLYALHLAAKGDKDGAVRVLTIGLHFSRDVANNGALFATVVAKNLIADHLRAMADMARKGQLSSIQQASLQQAVAKLGPDGLDWQSAVKRELGAIHGPNSPVSRDIERIIPDYVKVLNNPSNLPQLQQMIASTPPEVQNMIPNPKRILEEKQDLTTQLEQMRLLLR
jgi:hypothetical protein